MADFRQPDFDFSGDFLDTTTPAVSIPKPLRADEKKETAVEEKENKAESFGFEPVTHGKVTDYSAFPANRVYIANEKTILKSGAPPWIPPFDQDFMRYNAFMPPVIKDRDNYLMAASHNFSKMYRLSLDGLAATIDYYTKYQKALNNEDAKTTLAKRLAEAREWLGNNENHTEGNSFLKRYHESVIRGELKVMAKPVRLLSLNRMTHSQMKLFTDNGLGKNEAWDAYRTIKEEVRQKMLDMSCQIGDLQSSYTKGTETSYGDKNTNSSLKEKYGVLVKRQNGDAINGEEIKEIAGALDKIGRVFGDLKDISEEYGLKISHAGVKHMFARKFAGLFFDVHKAIGVSFANKDTDYLVLAHEYAHFLDSRAGKKQNHFFASDKPGAIENTIAKEFRVVMNKEQAGTRNSKYLNRTCECFARAMEQYAAYELSPEQYKRYCGSEAYAAKDLFEGKIFPRVKTLLVERHDLWHCVSPDTGMAKLREYGISPEDNTGPRFKKNFLAIGNKAEYKDKPMEAAQILIRNVLPKNKEAYNTALLEQGFSNPEATQEKLRQWIAETNRNKQREKETPSIER
ncbi:MAG: hypothetical protein LBP74_00095 [Treponema sp.]|jgi:hypothetical protein|nr:hypothetical protein [Treponema sp.]